MISYIFSVYASVNSCFHDTIYVYIKVLLGNSDKPSMKKVKLSKLRVDTAMILTKINNNDIIINTIKLMLCGIGE